ncbi:MAG TPA: hypothetical protein VN720_08265 [Rudaea sp.]|nr:hypothetical protein [Rudaea sp.]
MTTDKYLVAIGLSDEDEAHLRLLMRRAAIDHLSHMWRWGTEDKADLIIADPATFAGQMARQRAFNSGKRCAVLGSEELREGEMRLARPLRLESVSELLNEVGAASEFEGAGTIIPNAQNFYDLEELTPAEEIEEVELHLESGQQREARPAQGLDDLLKPDSVAAKPAFGIPLELKEDTTIEAGHRATARSEKRVADGGGGLRRADRPSGEINLTPPPGLEPAPMQAPTTLRDYLRGNLLGGPATLVLKGSPSLTLDPKSRVFHNGSNSLQALVPYCRQSLPQRDWHPLTTAELAHIRQEHPAQPYSRLIWLATLVQSGGRLAAHLDPGGRYKLKDGTVIETELPTHARIGNVMRDMAKLNEIAAVSGAQMSEVFDVINAYEAIHALETERRQPRYSEAENSGGLFSKLRKSLIGR